MQDVADNNGWKVKQQQLSPKQLAHVHLIGQQSRPLELKLGWGSRVYLSFTVATNETQGPQGTTQLGRRRVFRE